MVLPDRLSPDHGMRLRPLFVAGLIACGSKAEPGAADVATFERSFDELDIRLEGPGCASVGDAIRDLRAKVRARCTAVEHSALELYGIHQLTVADLRDVRGGKKTCAKMVLEVRAIEPCTKP